MHGFIFVRNIESKWRTNKNIELYENIKITSFGNWPTNICFRIQRQFLREAFFESTHHSETLAWIIKILRRKMKYEDAVRCNFIVWESRTEAETNTKRLSSAFEPFELSTRFFIMSTKIFFICEQSRAEHTIHAALFGLNSSFTSPVKLLCHAKWMTAAAVNSTKLELMKLVSISLVKWAHFTIYQ